MGKTPRWFLWMEERRGMGSGGDGKLQWIGMLHADNFFPGH